MADFKTHLTVTSIVGSMASIALNASGFAAPRETLFYFILAITGGLLPDIDSDSSVPVRMLFTFLATLIAFLAVFKHPTGDSVTELFLIWLGSFAAIKYLVFSMFTKLTVHRGIIHSVPAGLLFGLPVVILLNRFFGFGEVKAWTGGLFLFSGFLLHLLMDEICSLNLSGNRPKKSSGTAFKFIHRGDLKTTALVYISVLIIFGLTPDHRAFVAKLTDTKTYGRLKIFPTGSRLKTLCKSIVPRSKKPEGQGVENLL